MAAIEAMGLSKRYGSVQAVADLSFGVEAGRVTRFIGPNGAGKSTTLRMLLGLVRPNSGSASVDGHVGAVLEDMSYHPGRSGRNHLRVVAVAGGHGTARVDELLERVGLSAAANQRVKGYSTGRRQRLGIAAALVGDPEILVLDEPANGLDPPGIRWIRDLLRAEAERGRAVLVSSHLLSELAQSVDDVLVIADGELRAGGPIEHVLGGANGPGTRVRSRAPAALTEALRERGHAFETEPSGGLIVPGATPEEVGLIAAEHHIALVELGAAARSLLAGAAVGTSLLLTVLVSVLTEPTEKSVLIDVFASDTSGLFIFLLAVVGISGEWRHRTIAGSLLAAPSRLRFLAAKTLAFAGAGLLLSLSIHLVVSIVGFVILTVRDLPLPQLGELVELAVRGAGVAALGAALGVCLGALVRNQVVAIVGVLLLSFLLEPLLLGLAPDVGRFGHPWWPCPPRPPTSRPPLPAWAT